MIPGLPLPLTRLRTALSIVGAAALLSALVAVYVLGRHHESARWRLKAAETAAVTARAVALEQKRQRDIELRWQDSVDRAAKELNDARGTIAARDRALSALRLDAGRLRDQLAAYVAGGAGADPGASCEDRAAALAAWSADLAEAAAEVGRLAAHFTRERDQYAAEVVACVRAWPQRVDSGTGLTPP